MKPSLIVVLFTAAFTTALVSCERESPVPANPPAEPQAAAPKATVVPTAAEAPLPAKPYPLDVCIVSDEELDSMGKPISLVYQGQEYKFCCDDCPVAFNKDPQKYVAKLQAAVAAKANTAGQPQAPSPIQSQ